ncbi:hypothetical protein COU75_02700 [Candidatus Peregrinibacteria bacterium CG10_big_fil_rev_8_21_14_0_10_42_8]|nr:MAG: hypothetical protein COU75_02700 [Candidatus Peregrinibacteria bacterium CG10_big_fil_rev_8_21_14_0_10_42_8]
MHSPLAPEQRTETPSSTGGQKPPVLLEDVLERTRTIGLLDDDLVEVILAAYISKEIERRNPIWIMLVGNPSSNKTQLVSLLSKAADTVMIDVLTTNPFISGLGSKDKPQDLLPKLDGSCFICKDYTSFFGRSEETVKQLLSDLVSIYDGTFSKHSGARGTVRYNASFSHIGCVTPMGLNQRQTYMNQVGARFLTIRVAELSDDDRKKGFVVAWSEDLKERITAASEAASQYVTALCEGIRTYGVQLEPVPAEIRTQLNLLAELVARARGEVRTRSQKFETEDGEVKTFEEVEEIQKEEPFRALHQLKALCRSLAILRGKEGVTQREFLTAKRVALSSMPVQRAEALAVFHVEPKVTAKEGSDILNKNYKTIKRHLDQLAHLGVLRREKDIDGKTWIYEPDPKFSSLILPTSTV